MATTGSRRLSPGDADPAGLPGGGKDPIADALSASYDEIYVTDGDGRTLWVSDACLRLYGLGPEALIGRGVRDLERRGIYAPSAAALALRSGATVTVRQRTRLGRTLIVTAKPVVGPSGNVERVVCNSRDLDALQVEEEGIGPAAGARRGAQARKPLRAQHIHGGPSPTAHGLSETAWETEPGMPDAGEDEDGTLATSPKLQEAVALMRRVAELDVPVFLTGETGVGKTHFAHRIHAWSPRRDGPFLAVHPASLPEGLFEAELFGYEAGAYTGARREGSPGLIRGAEGGTLLLDEIGELSQSLQAKLLSFTDSGEFLPLGARRPVRANVRLIVATHRSLRDLVAQGQFRADLYYRLTLMPIAIPPLRERKEDILPLAEIALSRLALRHRLVRRLDDDAKDYLRALPWHGNVRELMHVVERAAILSADPLVDVTDVRLAVTASDVG